jgi:hypothetical protein
MKWEVIMRLRERVVCLYKIFKNTDDSSLREIAKQTTIPKSSVHRHKVNQQIRIKTIGHDFFETEKGHIWLRRLILAVILIFGIQSGVGAETISLFFSAILITLYAGLSTSSVRKLKQEVRHVVDEYGDTETNKVLKSCEDKALHLGGDETGFGKYLFLLLMELKSGFIFIEKLVTDRKYKTWWSYVKNIPSKLKRIVSFGSDGGKAVVKVGKSLVDETTMDLFHLLQDVKKLFATKFHSKRRSLLSKLNKLTGNPSLSKKELRSTQKIINTKLATLDKGQKTYWNSLFTISTRVHPFENISDIKTSVEVEIQLSQQLEILRTMADECEIADKEKLLNRFESRIKPMARLNDLWHNWVEQSVLCKTASDEIKEWAKYKLLPWVYWQEQVRKSKGKKNLKEHYQTLVEKANIQLKIDPLTEENLTKDWIDWGKGMALKYQRTTSAIEGRNARLAHHYFSARGIKPSHINSLTVLHNFWIKRKDNTTAAERLCGYKPPDLLEHIIKEIGELPLPRKLPIDSS